MDGVAEGRFVDAESAEEGRVRCHRTGIRCAQVPGSLMMQKEHLPDIQGGVVCGLSAVMPGPRWMLDAGPGSL
jgi:hypothetical protein